MQEADIMDLKLELWLRLRNDREIRWTTKDGQEIPIRDMSIGHIRNAINYFERKGEMADAYYFNSEFE